MAKYVDGFVLVVAKKNIPEYKKMAKEGQKAWKKFGALDYKECVIDDEKPKHVTMTFRKMTNAKPGELIVFSFITFRSRKHRDQVNAKVMAFMEEKYANQKDMSMPFDMDKMAYAGFEVMVDY